MKSINKKLMAIQSELKAVKGQYNNFAKFKYRSLEDIMEAVKPLLLKNNLTLTLSDDIQLIGERYYIKSISTLTCIESGEQISATAFAREPGEKKGMDASQITGTSSSYSRKYNLNGLFAIDDNADADVEIERITSEQVSEIEGLIAQTESDLHKFLKWQQVDSVDSIRSSNYKSAVAALNKKVKA